MTNREMAEKLTLALMLLRMSEKYGIEVEFQLEQGEHPRDVARLVPPNTAFACIARERIGKIVIRMEQTSRPPAGSYRGEDPLDG